MSTNVRRDGRSLHSSVNEIHDLNSSKLYLISYVFKVEVVLSTCNARHTRARHRTKKRETGDKLHAVNKEEIYLNSKICFLYHGFWRMYGVSKEVPCWSSTLVTQWWHRSHVTLTSVCGWLLFKIYTHRISEVCLIWKMPLNVKFVRFHMAWYTFHCCLQVTKWSIAETTWKFVIWIVILLCCLSIPICHSDCSSLYKS